MYVGLGITLILMGIFIIIKPQFYHHIFEFQFDFTGYNIPLGIAMIVLGVAFIWTEVKNKLKKRGKGTKNNT